MTSMYPGNMIDNHWKKGNGKECDQHNRNMGDLALPIESVFLLQGAGRDTRVAKKWR